MMYEFLNNQIERLYKSKKQTDLTSQIKENIRFKIEQQLKARLPREVRPIVVEVSGSSYSSELALNSSDLDLSVYIGSPNYESKREMVKFVAEKIKEMKCVSHGIVIGNERPFVVFRFKMYIDGQEMKVDLQVNNINLARSTKLIKCYAKNRFPKLAVILKLWAKSYDVHDASQGRLSSYGLNLLLIHYLQYGCQPPVLPCFHKKLPQYFNRGCDPDEMDQLKMTYKSQSNNQNLGQLLIGFFRYYSGFDFSEAGVSVEDGQPVNKYGPNRNALIFIEEPFNNSNVAKAIRSPNICREILESISLSYRILNYNLDLEPLFN